MNKDIRNIGSVIKLSWSEKIRKQVRGLRKNQTSSEKILWSILRDRKLSGKKFYRQHPIIHFVDRRPYYFIADFYCHEIKLIIEIDGKIHDQTKDYDEQRTLILNELGIRIFRIKNEELKNIDSVLKKIEMYF